MNIKKINGIVGFSGLKRKRYYFPDSKVTLYSDTKRFDITVQ